MRSSGGCNTSSRVRGNAVTKEETQDLHFEANSTWVLLQCILECLHCPLSQPIGGRVTGGSRQMTDTIAVDKCSKLVSGESRTVPAH